MVQQIDVNTILISYESGFANSMLSDGTKS